ncbi:MAG: hypothetical protein ACXW11_02330 [Methylotenera sp.]
MGGMNSGRRNQGGKKTTEDCRSLDVRQLQKDALLEDGKSFGWSWTRNGEKMASIQVQVKDNRVTLNYRHQSNGSEWETHNYPVLLEWTPCNYGGLRAWFRCPASGCGRRVAKLHIGSAGIFACRHCYQLAYASQRANADDRATRQADKIRNRLGWVPGIFYGHGIKPKGMHWKAYQRLVFEYDSLVNIILAGMQKQLQMMRAGWD